MSLSRLGQPQGQCAEAHALLAPIYGWFTEGFDTADLNVAFRPAGDNNGRRHMTIAQRGLNLLPTMQVEAADPEASSVGEHQCFAKGR
jgi:hypothetical protein